MHSTDGYLTVNNINRDINNANEFESDLSLLVLILMKADVIGIPIECSVKLDRATNEKKLLLKYMYII